MAFEQRQASMNNMQRRLIPCGLGPAIEGNRENGEHEVQQNITVFQCVSWLAESQPGALKWAESSGGVGIVSTVVPVGTFNRPF